MHVCVLSLVCHRQDGFMSVTREPGWCGVECTRGAPIRPGLSAGIVQRVTDVMGSAICGGNGVIMEA